MASQRIKADIRNALVSGAVKKAFADEEKQLEQMREDLGKLGKQKDDICYREAFEPAEYRKIKSLPRGWLPMDYDVKVQVSGSHVTQLKWSEARPVPHKFTSYSSPVSRIIEPDNPALITMKEYKEAERGYEERRADLNKRKSELKVQVIAVINSVTTTGRLKEIWPECAELLPMGSESSGDMLPAIILKDLNKTIGLGKFGKGKK